MTSEAEQDRKFSDISWQLDYVSHGIPEKQEAIVSSQLASKVKISSFYASAISIMIWCNALQSLHLIMFRLLGPFLDNSYSTMSPIFTLHHRSGRTYRGVNREQQ